MADAAPSPPERAEPAKLALRPVRQRRRRWMRRTGYAALSLLVVYLLLAYVALPLAWRHFEHHPVMQDAPKTTTTGQGIPGDALNIGLVATQKEVVAAMLAAGWYPADPTTLRSSVHIAVSVVFKREYDSAPISNLYLWGRRQDLSFEKPVAGGARERHHARLWKSEKLGVGNRPLWIGSATFDRSVGISHYTGEVTHHIAPDIDTERDYLMEDLSHAGQLVEIFQVTGVGATLNGRNGGGDRYFTDGELTVGVISADNLVRREPPKVLANPPGVQAKNDAMASLRSLLK